MPVYEIDSDTRTWLSERYWADDELLRDAGERFASVGPMIEVPAESGALPADGHLDTLELSDTHADFAEDLLERAGLSDRTTVHRGPAFESLEALTGPYDLAFVDADKEGYPAYLEAILPLLRPGATIAFDNVSMSGRVADPDNVEPAIVAVRDLHALLIDDVRVDANVLPIGDGVAVCTVR
jgi:caffeoyl-CoA O-methyltransferase